ncbi:MAG TPA: Ig-like domain repeat protein [Pyrinomonadaceae bacterium]|nr:Ig-like domain repeat protein [Pyrinomonadaceae bacterium]
MPSKNRPPARKYPLQNQSGFCSISRSRTFLLVLLSLGTTILLSSVLADARIERVLQKDAAIYRRTTSAKSGKQTPTRKRFDGSSATVEVATDDPFIKHSTPLLLRLQSSSYSSLVQAQNNNNHQFDSEVTRQERDSDTEYTAQVRSEDNKLSRKPREERLVKAHSFDGDLRDLPYRRPVKRERPEREGPEPNPRFYPGTSGPTTTTESGTPSMSQTNAPAPAPGASFDGLDFANWGDGHPPDTNGDVGPTYYIQTVNTSIGVYRKSDGLRVAAFTFDTFMSLGNFGNPCDTNNFGDPVVLYDSFEDRWIITDFAFSLDGAGNVINPPGAFQCIAASKTGDPVSGGWNYYSVNTAGGLGDYPKFGIWPDGLYMSVNMFDYAAAGSFQNPRVYAFNKAQMYAGAPTVQSVSFDAPAGDFTLLPGNARLQTGTPPPDSPNYFVSTWQFLNALSVYKFHVDWDRISLSTFTGPDVPLAATSWPNADVPNAPSLGGNSLDVLEIRAMMQNQYSNIGGAESLWTTHTVRRGDTSGFAAPRWYQVNVTGGTVAANIPQAATWDPDGANVIYRFMPSVAVDRMGDMALGYSTSSSTTKPAIKYAGRLATDPQNTLGQTEQVLIQGSGTQTGNCGGSPCARWGDYSAMSLDPNGCTFWYTNEYYTVDGLNDLTRIGSFAFPQCTPVGAGGTVSGTVTDSVTSNPISGAKVALGSRTTITNASGIYSFSNLPAGTYPGITASFAGYGSSTSTSILVIDGVTTTQNFSLTPAPLSTCFVDTSQADFQTGVSTNVDLTTSPGDVVLLAPANVDQQNLTVTNNGFAFTSTSWAGQTFTPAVTGSLSRVDLDLFCSGCTGTAPNLTISIRATSGNPAEPTGADLAVATIPGFNSGAGGYFSANFSTPATLTAGTKYAVIIRATANPSAGTYAYVCSCSSPNSNPYAAGQRVTSNNSGTTWTADNTAGGRDLGFIAYMKTGFSPSGNLISGAHDANPPAGLIPHWTTLSWNAITPVNTAIKFQGAASNSLDGPFAFVGPDGTAATFFTTSGASLAQFNGFRYLKYKALLSTTDSTITPTLNSVTACFSDGTPMITAAAALVRQRGANANGKIATVSDPSQDANTLNVTATPLTGTGVTINNISVDLAGNVNADVAASCVATNSTFTLTVTNNSFATATDTLTVNVTAAATPTITPGGPTSFCTGGSVTLTSSSASGNQWYLNGNPIAGATNQQYVATVSGNYTVAITALGCTSTSVATTVTVNPVPATPTITPGGATTFCNGGSVTLTSSSASGNQWYLNGSPIAGATNQQYVATVSGNYTTIVTTGGCSSNPSAATTLTVNPLPATPTITPGGATTFCEGGSVTLTSSSATGNQWYRNGSPIAGATNQGFVATVSGNYTTIVTTGGCSSTPSAATTVTVNPVPATPTITAGGVTTFCEGGSVTLTSSSASGNQWYRNGSPIAGAINQQYVATVSGNYTTIVTIGGCSSTPSAATTVTVNPVPAIPTITPNGPTTFFQGGSVTLTASSATGNQWYLNGNPIAGATNQQYVANASGNYTVKASANGCTSAPSAATTVTVNPLPVSPTVTKSFNPTSIPLNSNSALSFTIINPNTTSGLSGVGFADNLPAGLLVAATPNVTGSCGGGTITATAGSSSVSLSGGTLTASPSAGSSCTFTVAVTGTTAGTKLNTTGAITSTEAGTGATSNTAGLTIVAPPAITKSFNPITIAPGGVATLTISITNPASNTVQLNGVGFTDNFPANLVLANPNGLVNTCGGTATATAGSGTVSLTGGTIPINTPCAVSVIVTSSVGGLYVNNTNLVSSTNGGAGNSASATLNVTAPPTISKLFQPNQVVQNGTTSLSFTISNPNANASLTGIAFADNLPAGLVVASPNDLTNRCGGTVTASTGSSSISLAGGMLGPGSACLISVKVKAPNTLGTLNNTTGPISATESGPGATSNTASLTVIAPPVAPTIAKGFGAASIPLNGTTSLTFTLSNPNSTVTLMNVSASDTLPTGLVVATPNHLSGNCTASIAANAGSNTIGITALNLAASSSCSFTVDVTGTSVGAKNNITGNASATYTAGSGNPVPITGGTATAAINVLKGDQTISFDTLPNKVFGDVDFIVSANASSGLPVTLTAGGNCTITSPTPGTVHITGAGSCTITAAQGGDSNYNAATNVVQSFDISKTETTTIVLASINPSDIGQNVIFTATVTPAANTNPPTGTVQFKDGANNLGAAINCVAGMGNTCTAQFSTSTLTTGTHTISAVYNGDTNFIGGAGVLTGGQVVTNQPTLRLILEEFGPNPNHAASLDSLLLLRDPFPINSLGTWYNFGPDHNTRVMVFVENLQLNPGESSSAVVVHLIDSNNQSYDVPAEDVRPERITGFAQVTFRLPDTLFSGDCTVQVKAHGQVSNSALIRVGP